MEFTVSDMTCGHCAGRITQAIKQVDAAATVDIDVAAHRVLVHSQATVQALTVAVRAAGYMPLAVNEVAGVQP